MSGSKWANPELLLGASCISPDPLGKYKCWAVKEQSFAHEVWNTISTRIVKVLQNQPEPLETRDMDLMLEMFMIGQEEALSIPTILFSCHDAKTRQRAMDLVHRSSILLQHPEIRMASCSPRRRPLAMEETAEVPALPPGVYATEPLRHCGVSVLISGEQRRSPRRATLGGIVFIAGLFYGIITLYACKQDSSMIAEPDSDQQFSFYEPPKLEEAIEGRHDSGADLSLDDMSPTAFSSPASSRGNSTKSNDPSTPGTFTTQASSISRGSSSASGPNPRPEPRRKHMTALGEDSISPELGNIFVSAPANSLDWALVEIENAELMLENISLNNRRFMTNSIYFRDQSLHTEAIHTKGVAREATEVDVLICTGNRDDALLGRLSSISSFQKAPGSKRFQELWAVKCINGTFFDGDCGSWVVERDTGNLCGIVVFGFPGTDTAYIIPAAHTFDRMQTHLKKRVELSTPELWSAREEFAKNAALMTPPTLQRADSARTIRTERGRSSIGQAPSIRMSFEEDQNPRPRSWSQNSIQSTVFDTRSLHSTSSHFSKIPTHLANETHLMPGHERLPSGSHSSHLRIRTNSTYSGSSTPSHRFYRPYSTASTFQSIDSAYGNPPSNNLWVRNLPSEPDEGDLREYFSHMEGFEGLRMKLNDPECFVQFTDVTTATEAMQRSDDHRFSSEDKWGIMVGYAYNAVTPAGTGIPSQEELELEISIAELLGNQSVPSIREPGARASRALDEEDQEEKRPDPPKRVNSSANKQVTNKSRMLKEMFAELGELELESRESDKILVEDSDDDVEDDEDTEEEGEEGDRM